MIYNKAPFAPLKKAESVAVFTATSDLNLVALKRDPDKDFRWLFYAGFGLDLYSNGIMVSRGLANGHPEEAKGLLRAINRSLKETVENPDTAIGVLALEEPLIRKGIEKRRLLYAYDNLVDTAETQEVGIGDVGEERLRSSIATIAASFDLARSPAPAKYLILHSFLPDPTVSPQRHPGNERHISQIHLPARHWVEAAGCRASYCHRRRHYRVGRASVAIAGRPFACFPRSRQCA